MAEPESTRPYHPPTNASTEEGTNPFVPDAVDGAEPGERPALAGYELLGPLGKGGMGVVYQARHVGLNRVVALKMLPRPVGDDTVAAARFLAEAQVVAAVRHPNVVSVFDYGRSEGRAYLAMELLPGGTLAERLKESPQLRPREAAELLEAIARGVGAAHEQGIVHRDLKPGNVLFAADGTPKVADFGLAKQTGSDLTATQALMGTPSYMAPEQAAGRGKFVGPPADVWALGVMLYECLAGRRPFQAADTMSLLTKIVNDAAPRVRSLVGRLPRELDVIVEKCLAKEPGDRYATASELAEDLRRWRAGEPIAAKPAGVAERAFKWAKRKPTLAAAWVLGALVLVLGGLGAVSTASWFRAERARDELATEQSRTEEARKQAVLEKGKTEDALKQVEKARGELQRTNAELDVVNYLSTIDLAYRSHAGNAALLETRALLNDCNPKLRNWEWHYLDRLAHPERALVDPDGLGEIERKQFYFLDAAFSPDGERLYVVGSDPMLRVWETKAGNWAKSVRSELPFLRTLRVSADGKRLLTTGPGDVCVWNAETLAVERRWKRPPNEPEARAWFAPDGQHVVTAAIRESAARIRDIASGAERKTYSVPDGEEIWAAGFPDGKLRLVTLDRRAPNDFRPSVVRVHDVEAGAPPVVVPNVGPAPGSRVFKAGLHGVVVDVSPDGHRVLVTTNTNPYRATIWDGRTQSTQELTNLQYNGPHWFSPDGTEILSVGRQKVTRTNLRQNSTREYLGPLEALRFATMSADGRFIAAAGGQGQPMRLWDATRPIGPVTFPRDYNQVSSIVGRFSPDGTRYLTWWDDGSAREYDTATGKELRILDRFPLVPNANGMGSRLSAASSGYSHDGRRVLLSAARADANQAHLLRVYDAATGKLEIEVPEKGRSGGAHAFTADGNGVYVYDDAGGTGVWDLATRSYRGVIPEVMRIYAVSPCGRFLLTDDTPQDRALPERRAGLRSAKTGKRVADLAGYPPVNSPDSIWLNAAFSRDGERVAVACPDLKVRIWNTAAGELLSTTRDPSSLPKLGLAFSPDGERLATSNGGFGADVWDVRTGRAVLPRQTFRMGAAAIAFTPDGRTLLMGGLVRELMTRVDAGR